MNVLGYINTRVSSSNKTLLKKLIKAAYNGGAYESEVEIPSFLIIFAQKHYIGMDSFHQIEQEVRQELSIGEKSINISKRKSKKLMFKLVKLAIDYKYTKNEQLVTLKEIGKGLMYTSQTVNWLASSIKFNNNSQVTFELVHYILDQNQVQRKAS